MRVVLVDDEPPGRLALRQQLAAFKDAEIVADCADGEAAVAAILRHAPDLLVLDVQMPGLNGFEVLERVGAEAVPAVVFVTAYDKYAVRAFEAHAVDYLLKPIDPDRFREAYQRAARRVASDDNDAARLERLVGADRKALERFAVHQGGRLVFVPVESVDWIEAEGNYAVLHAGAATHRLRRTLTHLAQRLAGRFVRARRSLLINVHAIKALEANGRGSYCVHLRTGARLISSRYAGRALRELLEER